MTAPPERPRGQQASNPGSRQSQVSGQSHQTLFAGIKFGRKLDPELFNSIARDAAKKVADSPKESNKSTQLRRFYDELCLWDLRVRQQPEKFSDYLPFIRMLNAKAAYAQGRKLVNETYVSLLHHTLREVTDRESLSVCKLFWEAFTGFYKQERAE